MEDPREKLQELMERSPRVVRGVGIVLAILVVALLVSHCGG